LPGKSSAPIGSMNPSDAPVVLGYRCSMTWGAIVPTIIAAAAAFLGVGYGARLSGRSETLNWTREQRLKAYTELLQAVENCYEAFELIAAELQLTNYDEGARESPKITNTTAEWGKWDSEIDRWLPQAELICSRKLQPYIQYIRLGVRSRHRILLMKLSYGVEINRKEWQSVSSMTHKDILETRYKFREDLTHIDPARNSFLERAFRLRRLRRLAAIRSEPRQ
jgi:hypothetical protein